MTSAYITDLIDHKERVAKHMGTATSDWITRDTSLTDNRENWTLMDILQLTDTYYMQSARKPIETLQLAPSLETLVTNTLVYFNECPPSWDVVFDLFHRAAVHDNSKFGPEEFDLFDQAFPILAKHAYGSDGYKAGLKLLGPALEHHYKHNDHHPEYNLCGVSGMHAVQQIEMCCDWVAASERSQTDIYEGLYVNKSRFKIDDPLYEVIRNTVIALKEA